LKPIPKTLFLGKPFKTAFRFEQKLKLKSFHQKRSFIPIVKNLGTELANIHITIKKIIKYGKKKA